MMFDYLQNITLLIYRQISLMYQYSFLLFLKIITILFLFSLPLEFWANQIKTFSH